MQNNPPTLTLNADDQLLASQFGQRAISLLMGNHPYGHYTKFIQQAQEPQKVFDLSSDNVVLAKSYGTKLKQLLEKNLELAAKFKEFTRLQAQKEITRRQADERSKCEELISAHFASLG